MEVVVDVLNADVDEDVVEEVVEVDVVDVVVEDDFFCIPFPIDLAWRSPKRLGFSGRY